MGARPRSRPMARRGGVAAARQVITQLGAAEVPDPGPPPPPHYSVYAVQPGPAHTHPSLVSVENCGSLCKMFFMCPHLRVSRFPGPGAGCIWRWLMMFPASGPHYPVTLQRRGCQQTSAASISKVNQYEPRAAAACGWRVGQLCPAQPTTGTAGGAWYLVWTGAAPKNRLRM